MAIKEACCKKSQSIPRFVKLTVPDHSTVSRRLGKLSFSLPVIGRKTERRVVVDSTGIKKDAQYWPEEGPIHQRNQNLSRIEEIGRAEWKRESDYHRCSLSETTMFRLKIIFGNTCSRRTFDNQASELLLACAALNRMTHLGMPDSYALSF